MKCHLYQPSRIKDGKRVKSRVWWARWRLAGDIKDHSESLQTSDKQVARKRMQ